ncbi:hypothetical protein WNY97_18005 [Pseudoalteromonas fuliginea]|uniref:hypothetical protein n=1 Tax=Pseudoalteromonas fuliginea TaxID=1872678 RepID=UPI0031791C5F
MRNKFLASFYSFFLLVLFGCDDQISSSQKKAHLEDLVKPSSDSKQQEQFTNVEDPVLVLGLVATHCKMNETAYINAKMQKVLRNPSEDIAYKLEPTDNVLSICVAKDDSSLSYRFGRINDIGLEKEAKPDAPFGSYYRQVGRIGESILFFSNGEYHYYIINSGGMGSGVTVNVYKNDTLITELFSGNDPYDDFVIATDLNLPKKLVSERQPFNKKMQ